VAGVAALYLAFNKEDLNGDGVVNHKDARAAATDHVHRPGHPGKDQVFGYGLVDAAKAAFAGDDDGCQDECDCSLDQLVSYLLDQLLSNLSCGHVSVDSRSWLQSLRTTLSQFLSSALVLETDSARSIATMFWQP